MLSKAFIVCVLDERIVFISPDFNLFTPSKVLKKSLANFFASSKE